MSEGELCAHRRHWRSAGHGGRKPSLARIWERLHPMNITTTFIADSSRSVSFGGLSGLQKMRRGSPPAFGWSKAKPMKLANYSKMKSGSAKLMERE